MFPLLFLDPNPLSDFIRPLHRSAPLEREIANVTRVLMFVIGGNCVIVSVCVEAVSGEKNRGNNGNCVTATAFVKARGLFVVLVVHSRVPHTTEVYAVSSSGPYC